MDQGSGQTAGQEAVALRLDAFRGRRGLQFGILSAALTLTIALCFFGLGVLELVKGPAQANEVDFIVFWGAARLALAGDPVGAFDLATLAGAQTLTPSNWLPWVYPPGFLALVAPLGLLPFWAAWTLFAWGSLAAYALAVRPFAGGVRPLWLGIALAPAVLPALLLGQTTLWWLAGLLAALSALRGEREVLAGILIGLLTLKPQLGLLIPVALAAGGHWRAFASASATAVALAVIPTLAFGWDYWPALLDGAAEHRDRLVSEGPMNQLMISPHALMLGLGVPHQAAIAIQWALAGLAAILVWTVWRRESAGFDLRAAVLLAGIAVATPYMWYYEGAVLALVALFFWRAGIFGPGPAGALATLALCLGPAPMTLLEFLTTGDPAPVRETVAPLSLLAFAVAAWAALATRAQHVKAPAEEISR